MPRSKVEQDAHVSPTPRVTSQKLHTSEAACWLGLGWWDNNRPVTSLAHQAVRKVFWERSKFLNLCPIVLNYTQCIFPGGDNFCRGASLRPKWLLDWATTSRTATLALVHSTAGYCAPAWCHSAHTRLIDPAINNALRTVTGYLSPTPTDNLPLFAGIQPAESLKSHIVSARRNQCEGWAWSLPESIDIRDSIHGNAQIKSPSTFSLLLDFVHGNKSPCLRGSPCKTYSVSIKQGRDPSKILPWPTGWEILSFWSRPPLLEKSNPRSRCYMDLL